MSLIRRFGVGGIVTVLLALGASCAGEITTGNGGPNGTNPDGTNPDGTNPDGTNPSGERPDGEATYLLTKKHIEGTLRQGFGIETTLDYNEPSFQLFESSRLAATHSLSDSQEFFSAMERVVDDHFASFLACSPNNLDAACLQTSIEQAGKKLFRRALTSEEVARYTAIANSQGQENFAEGAHYSFVALLNSPNFLYQRFPKGRLNDQQMAARLGFFLLGGNPDTELIDAAAAGELSTSEEILAHTDRILASSDTTGRLFADVLNEIWRVNHVDSSLVATLFPEELAALQDSLMGEFRRTAESIGQKGDWRGILDNQTTFVNRQLAQHYDLDTVPDSNSTWVEVPMPDARSGLLSSGLMMAAHSGSKYSNTIHRGLFLLNHLLCRTVPTIENLDELLDETGFVLSDDDTVVERVEKVGADSNCSGCHNQFDPMGLVFENFDEFGRYRTSYADSGDPVVSDALVNGENVSTVGQLAQVLTSDSENLARCFFEKVHTYGSGSVEKNRKLDLATDYGLSGDDAFDFAKLIRAIVSHENFRYTQAVP